MLIKTLLLHLAATMPASGVPETPGLQRELARAEYDFALTSDHAWSAPNRAHGLRSRIDADGLELFPRSTPAGGVGAPWRLELRTTGFGREGDVRASSNVRIASEGPRVELSHGAFTEWFVNDERGLEQGWTIPAPPPGRAGAALRIELEVRGLQSLLAVDGRSARFVDDAQELRLSYAGLRAWDAAGRELEVRLLPTPGGFAVHVEDNGATYPITVDPILGGADWTAEGDQEEASFGASIANAGDVDGDGFEDVLVGAYLYDSGQLQEGRAYLYMGTSGGLSPAPAWVVDGEQAGAVFGSSVAGAGDVNADGFDDVLIGAPGFDAGESNEGQAFLYLGSALGPSTVPDWTLEGQQQGAALGVVAGVRDVDGDGYDDVLVGALDFSNGQTREGRVFFFRGSPNGLSPTPDWTAESNQQNAGFGGDLAGAGDVNGDGFDDLVVGASTYSDPEFREGAAFLFLGSVSGPSTDPAWITTGDVEEALHGGMVSGAGDLNGDDFDDLVVGAIGIDNPTFDEGRARVYFGSAAGPSSVADWVMEGNISYARLGSAASAGDMDRDGYGDLILGAFTYTHLQFLEGAAFIYFGSASGPELTPGWMAYGEQYDAFFGSEVATADVDGDGFPDLLVGAPGFTAGQAREGGAFLYPGPLPDCNQNGVPDAQDLLIGLGEDCNANGVLDECEVDCNDNGSPDDCDLASGSSPDCNRNGSPDECDIAAVTSLDCDGNGVPDECEPPPGPRSDCDGDSFPDGCESVGTLYCFGDGSATACPCENTGAPGHGCGSGAFAAGARVVALGFPTISFDALSLCVSSSSPNQPGLFFQGDDALDGGLGIPFGDGLRCAGTNVVRLEVAYADGSGGVSSSEWIALDGGATAGDVKRYQWWYRDPVLSPCGTGFNFSNGAEIAWLP